jgi:hypothetical protein
MQYLTRARKSRAKARPFGMNRFSAGLKSSSPLLKQGAPTRFGVEDIGGSFSGSHADSKALTIWSGMARLKSYPDKARRLIPYPPSLSPQKDTLPKEVNEGDFWLHTICPECHKPSSTASVGRGIVVNGAIVKELAAPHGQEILPSGEQRQSRSDRHG